MRESLQRLAEYERIFGSDGYALALKAKLARGPVEVETRPAGLKHPFWMRLKTSDMPTLQKILRDQEYRFDGNPKVIIDAGANIGVASVFFAATFPHARIISIEPEPGNFALLEKNTRAYPNITAIRAAVWKKNGEVALTDPQQGPWAYRVGDGQGTESLTIDEIMSRFSLTTIDLLKLDIEGAEKELFESPGPWLGKVNAIMIELHDLIRVGCSRSFYLATRDFKHEERRGETVLLTR